MKLNTYLVSIATVVLSSVVLYYFQYEKQFYLPDQNLNETLLLTDIYGKKISGFENKKYIIVNFWATWCPPCVEETPSLVRFAEKYEKEFFLLALSQDDSKKEIFSFIKTFPSLNSKFIHLLHDNSQAIARSFKVNKLPETFIYSVEKNKFIQFSGSTNWDDPAVLDLINKSF